MVSGVSVVICTHNGEKRIEPVLSHILAQENCSFDWEVIIVDNASTDDLVSAVSAVWTASVPLRIINEPAIGVGYARQTGIKAAKFNYICFVDDDNYLQKNYLRTLFDFMEAHPDAGAVGGLNDPPVNTEFKDWFERYQAMYAIGPQAHEAGKMEKPFAALWGAGMCVRKEAWQKVLDDGFVLLMRSRTGDQLLSGEDNEICYLLRLYDYALYYEPDLRLVHQIAGHKLTWTYCCRMKKGFGATSVVLSLYRMLLGQKFLGKPISNRSWLIELLSSLWKIVAHPVDFLATALHLFEGNFRILQMQACIGSFHYRLKLLWRLDQTREVLYNRYQHLL